MIAKQGWRNEQKIRTFQNGEKNGDTSSLKCFSNTLISGVSEYAKMSVSKQSAPYCEGWRCQSSQLCRNSPLEELCESNFQSENFVKSENIYQIRCAFAGIVRNKISMFDFLSARIFLRGSDI